MWTFIHMLLEFGGDEDSPLKKIMPYVHGANFLGITISNLVMFIFSILPIFLPAVLILSASTLFQTEAVDHLELYEEAITVDFSEYMKSNAQKYKRKHDCDIVEINDFTMITVEMLIAIDNTKFDGDYTKVSKETIKDTINDITSESYEIVEVIKERNRRVAVSDQEGNYLYYDNGKSKLEKYEKKYPGGHITTERGIIYYNYTVEIELTKAIVTYTSLSFEEILSFYKFDEIKKEMAKSYYIVMNERIVLFSGKSGNYRFTEDINMFLTPIEVSYPLSENMYVRMTSGFGYREYMLNNVLQKGQHNGIDFGLPVGTPIVATADGVVTRVSNSPTSYGRWLEIKHSEGYTSRYAHNNSILVNEGDSVSRGEMIALSGNTGKSTGAHLHFEIRLNNNPINPLPLINLISEESE